MNRPAPKGCEWGWCNLSAGHRGQHGRGVEPPAPGGIAAANLVADAKEPRSDWCKKCQRHLTDGWLAHEYCVVDRVVQRLKQQAEKQYLAKTLSYEAYGLIQRLLGQDRKDLL